MIEERGVRWWNGGTAWVGISSLSLMTAEACLGVSRELRRLGDKRVQQSWYWQARRDGTAVRLVVLGEPYRATTTLELPMDQIEDRELLLDAVLVWIRCL